MGAIGPCQGACDGRAEAGVMGGCGGCWWWGPPSSALRTGFDRLRANGAGSARAVGSGGCDGGDGDAPRRAPALGSRFRENDDGGVRGRRVLMVSEGWGSRCDGTGASRNAPTTRCGGARGRGSCLRGSDTCGRPFDRLRANGFGKRACGGEEGMRGGTETPRAAPRPWVPAFARTTMAGVWAGEGCWWRGAPFDRLRVNGGGRRACGGESGTRRGLVVGVPCPAHLWIPAFAGTTVGVGGLARAAGRGRRSRSGGTGDSRIAPTTGCGGVGDARGGRWGGAPPMPLWIPAFAGMTREGGPLRQAQGERSCEAPLWWGVAREGGVPACAGTTAGGVGGGRGMPTRSAARESGRP